MAGSSSASLLRGRWTLFLSFFAVVAVIVVGLLLWQIVGVSSLGTVSEAVDQFKPWLGGVRLGLIGLLAILWPQLLSLWLRGRAEDELARAHWMALRWRVVGWLLVIELVLGWNLIFRFVAVANGHSG